MLTVTAGIGMGAMGERLVQRDVAIGIILALSLGLGLLFLHFFTAYATQATALLFGNVLAVDMGTVWTLLGLGVFSLGTLAFISRPLLFASLQPELAEAKGVLAPALFGALCRPRGVGGRGMRADRGRVAGFCPNGRSGRSRTTADDACRQRPRPFCRACTVGSLDLVIWRRAGSGAGTGLGRR